MIASTLTESPPMMRRMRVRGLVPGVGFRPFVYRLARRYELAGFVANHAASSSRSKVDG